MRYIKKKIEMLGQDLKTSKKKKKTCINKKACCNQFG